MIGAVSYTGGKFVILNYTPSAVVLVQVGELWHGTHASGRVVAWYTCRWACCGMVDMQVGVLWRAARQQQ